ncbi:amino acid adenylation domain-containing protein [Gordonia sp. (in: high G+C Gram-positive bacteria)]|uniref:amino acid adenylation domain-containing protein n=1 Tax=Gordonia sp. (in: high G+C Gram-positive bacteria) TaxID=84139 RepID=UPI00333F0CC9
MSKALAESTVPSLVARQAMRTPDHIAVVDQRIRLTYRDLAQQTADLAAKLIDAGVGPESVVAVGMPRSAEMVVTVLAAMASGGAFVPVDPTWPAARRDQVIADAGASVVVADPATVEWPVPVLTLDVTAEPRETAADPIARLAALPMSNPRPGDGLRLAYVIFTSGSTGTPKGAMIRHEAICERLVWQREEILGFGDDDATLFKAPLSFDISVNEILLPLVSGGRVVVAATGEERDPDRLLELIETEHVTFVYLVSSMLDALLEMDRDRAADGRSAMAGLRHVWCGGEVLTPGLFARFRQQTDTTLYHGYGPAEATIGVSHVIYRESAERIATSIGKPNPRTRLYVLDERLTPLGVGEPGELYAAGFLLGRGYVNAPGLTGSRFVADPFGPGGARMYRTGDRARWTSDGSLEFLGRVDNQVKLRGRRIELEEIEAAVASAVGVRHCAVAVADVGNTQRLVAYVTASADRPDDWSADVEVQRSCAITLPDYMIPEIVVTLDAMPTTANGKVDRRALPAPARESTAGSLTPSTPEEDLVCGVFAEVLGLDAVAADDDFFALGGDSIIAIRVISALRRDGFTVRVRDVFTARTPIDLAVQLRPSGDPIASSVDPAGAAEPTPILRWLHEVASPVGLDGFHQGICLTTPAGMTRDVVQSALNAVVRAHPILAATLASAVDITVPNTAVPNTAVPNTAVPNTAVPNTTAQVNVHVGAVEPHTDDAALAATADDHAAQAAKHLDHGTGRVLSATWIDRPGSTGRLVVIAHHAVIDGISLRVIADDLAIAVDDPDAVSPEPVPWRGWAAALAAATTAGAFDDERDFWAATCAAAPGDLGSRSLDPVIDTVATEADHQVELGVDLTRRLIDSLPAAVHGSPNDALVAALAVAVTEHLGTDAVTVEMEGHGRESDAVGDIDLSRTVGWFTTLYPVRIDLSEVDRTDSAALVKGVKEQLRRVPRNGIGYGALRHLAADPAPAHRAPVLFNYLGRFAAADADWAMAAATVPYEGRDPRMPLPRPLEVNAVVADGPSGPVMSAVFSRASGVLTDDAVLAIADRWVEVLTGVASADVSGHTASDFPTVNLTAADVAELEAAHLGLLDVSAPTPVQEGIAFHSAASDVDPYLVQQIITVDGHVDADTLARAAHTAIGRHSALSARFVQVRDGATVVVTGDTPAPEFRVVDATGAADPVDAVRRAADEDRARGFDLTAAPLTRYTLVTLGPTSHRLVQTVHHIVADGWSVPLVLTELRRAYTGGPRATADRHRAAMRALHSRDRAAEHRVWTEYLDGVDEATSIVAALDVSTRTEDPEHNSGMPGVGVRTRRLDATGLADYARTRGVTVSSVLHTAWGLALGLITGRTDVLFGSVVSGRGPGLDGVVGLLVNTVPARVRWSPSTPVSDAVDTYARAAATVADHPHVALSDLHRTVGVSSLFDTLIVIENLPDVADDTDGAPFTFGPIDVIEAPHYPLTVMAALHDEIVLTVTNRRSELGDRPADAATDLFVEVLAAMASGSTVTGANLLRLGSLEIPAPEAPPAELTIAARVSAALSDLPDVVFSGVTTPGSEIAARTCELRDRLHDSGVGPEDRVVVQLERGVDLLCASLAVLAAGAVLVPVDPAYPDDRIAHMRAASTPTVVIDGHTDIEVSGAQVPVPPRPDNGAYLLFTSGSTGVPKAVLGTQRAVAARLQWQHPDGAARHGTRLVKSSLSFVDGLTELLAAALAAERIVIADEAEMRDLTALAALVDQWQVDELTTIPSAAAELKRTCAAQVRSIRRWILSAEPLTADVVTLMTADGAEIENFYGSSEVTGDVTAGHMTDGAAVTVGRPTPGSGVRILDRWLRPVPDGAIGELHVAGPQTARGYHGAAALTASRFIADPFGAPGDRLYRTGDLAARTADGSIVLHGRVDLQFSVRGMRVEAGEVEAALLGAAGVAAAVVDMTGTPPQLVGYVVAEPGAALDAASLAAAAGTRLPRHAVPDRIVVLDHLPLTPNGKVDRAALPDPADTPATGGRAPANAAEQAVVTIIGEILGRPDVGPDDDFFALGGDSISSTRVVAQAIRAGFSVTAQDVFRLRTAAALAAACAPEIERTAIPPTPVLHQIRTSGLGPADLVYTETAPIDAGDVDDLRERLTRLAESVDATTMRVTPRNKLIWASEAGGDVAPVPLTVLTRPGADADAAAEAAESARSAIDITAGRAVAAVVVTGDDGSTLVLAAHALAMDRASLHAAITALVAATPHTAPSVVDVAGALDTATGHDDFRVYGSGATEQAPELSSVEDALAAAVRHVLGDDVLIDVETDLRSVPGVHPAAAGPFTPTVPAEQAGPASTRHWHALAQVHAPAVRKALRRRPSAQVLVTRLYGPSAEPSRAEGAERRYPIVARYRSTDDGDHHVSVIGDDVTLVKELARAWRHSLDDTRTQTQLTDTGDR